MSKVINISYYKRKKRGSLLPCIALFGIGWSLISFLPPQNPNNLTWDRVHTGTFEVTIAEPQQITDYEPFEIPEPIDPNVLQFTQSYPDGQIDRNYLQLLNNECEGDQDLLKTIVAIATAETAQGRDTILENNFWGWHKNGNRYYDPNREEMAREIVDGIRSYYSNIGSETAIANIYTGGDSTSTWQSIFDWAMSQMN